MDKMRYIMLGLSILGGLMLYEIAKYAYHLHRIKDLESEIEEKTSATDKEMEELEKFGDCPQCGLPAEVPTATITREYNIHCLGEHEPIPVKEIWIQV